MVPFFSRLAEFASDLQKHAVVTAVATVLLACVPALVPKISYKARSTRIIFLAIGFFILVCGLLLGYVKLSEPTIKVSPTTLILFFSVGIVLLVVFCILWWLRRRAMRNQLTGLADAAATHIRMLQQELGARSFGDLTTTDGESVVFRLMSLIRGARTGRRIVVVGQPGSGKTATLLKLAADCRQLRSGRQRPLIAVYVDLAQYAARTMEALQLHEFILNQFGEPLRTWIREAWADSSLDVGWVFVFDHADLAELQRGIGQRSWHLEVADFVNRRSGLAPFHSVIAARRPPEGVDEDYLVLKLGGLTAGGRDKLLAQAHVNPADVTALTMDSSLDWYLKNPAMLELLAPTLARNTWTTSDNVHKAMGAAIDRLLRRPPLSQATDPSSVWATAKAAVEFLRTRPSVAPSVPGDRSEVVTHVASARHLAPQFIDRELTLLENCGILRRIAGRKGTKYIEFGPAVAAYFYASTLLEDRDRIRARDLLLDLCSRLTAVSLLKVADDEIITRFAQDVERLLDQAIASLPRLMSPLAISSELAETSDDALPKGKQGDGELGELDEGKLDELDEGKLDELRELVHLAHDALSVLVQGTQNRLELLGRPLRHKAIKFTKLVMKIADTDMQASLLEVSSALGTPEQAMSIMAHGLDSGQGTKVLDAADRMVNFMSEITELDGEYRGQLIRVIALVGLRSFNINRGRSDLPNALRLADGAGAAAIILYGVIFGLAGLLQLINYWRYPVVQVVEVLTALLVAGPMIAARYNSRWRRFVLGTSIEETMHGVSKILALPGAAIAAVVIIYDLATFTLPLMPLVVCYSLIWPACALFYLESERSPTIANVVFPLPRRIQALWHSYILEHSRANRGNRQSLSDTLPIFML